MNKHVPPLETVSPTRKEDTGQTNSHWRLGKTSKKSIIIGSKGLGNAHFFWQPERRQIKTRFTNGLAAGAKRRHLWQAWKASRGCNPPLFVKVSSFPSLLTQN
nr:MAG TPA: hypothetical protein [Caudoviricetes sp.]